jgi:site-specific DNA-methyltransferase (adenine-specific)
VTVKRGRIASVDKGDWDRSMGFSKDHDWNVRWMQEARRVLKPGGTLWVSGTHHVILSLGFALQSLGFKIIKAIRPPAPGPA